MAPGLDTVDRVDKENIEILNVALDDGLPQIQIFSVVGE